MEESLINLFINNGVAVAVVIYFLWKDATLTKENSDILEQVKALLILMIKNEKVKTDEKEEDI